MENFKSKYDFDLVEAGKRVKWLVDSGQTEHDIKTWLKMSANLDIVSFDNVKTLIQIFFS